MILGPSLRHRRLLRRWSSALFALVLLPGFVLPPSCAACPHGAEEIVDAVAEHHGGTHGSAAHDADPHGDHEDCGCPCDVQCGAPGLPAAEQRTESDADDAETHVATITATALRAPAPPHPPFFIPLSNAPPR